MYYPARFLLLISVMAGTAAMTACSGADEDGAAEKPGRREQPSGEETRLWQAIKRRKDINQQAWASFYQPRNGAAYWVDTDASWLNAGEPSDHAQALLEALEQAAAHGLNPQDYAIAEIRALLEDAPGESADAVAAEILLMQAYLDYYRHLIEGRYPELAEATRWYIKASDFDAKQALQALGRQGPAEALAAAQPGIADYGLLRDARRRMLRIAKAGGWPRIEAAGLVRPGEHSAELPRLRERLAISGELTRAEPQGEAVKDPTLFDPATVAAFKAFQKRHGIKADGVIGPDARKMLSYPAAERLAQIDANLERLRWLPHQLETDRIMINIAAYDFRAYRNGEMKLEMPVVVGDELNQTPAFSDVLEYLEVNPYWNVPNSIVVNELAPKLEENPYYLAARNMQIYENWDPDADTVDADDIDWDDYADPEAVFPYVIRQEPGEGNALGRIKFMFPNKYSIYLHDTPETELFEEADRTFSHGCIRLQKPMAVADFVLRHTPGWDVRRVQSIIDTGNDNTRIDLAKGDRIAVYIYYATAWADADGSLYFRPDLYQRDTPLISKFLAANTGRTKGQDRD